MSRLEGYDAADKARIKAMACQLIEGQIERGVIACTDEAIRAAMPQAIEDARQAVSAAHEFLCG